MKTDKPSSSRPSSTRFRPSGEAMSGQMPSRMRPFARSLPMQLMRARELVMQHFRAHLHEHDLTDQQWRIIRALAEAEAVEIGD
jgi:hypothetical protein